MKFCEKMYKASIFEENELTVSSIESQTHIRSDGFACGRTASEADATRFDIRSAAFAALELVPVVAVLSLLRRERLKIEN